MRLMEIYCFPKILIRPTLFNGEMSIDYGNYEFVFEEFVEEKYSIFVSLIPNWKLLFEFNNKNHMAIMSDEADNRTRA